MLQLSYYIWTRVKKKLMENSGIIYVTLHIDLKNIEFVLLPPLFHWTWRHQHRNMNWFRMLLIAAQVLRVSNSNRLRTHWVLCFLLHILRLIHYCRSCCYIIQILVNINAYRDSWKISFNTSEWTFKSS